MPKRRTSKLSQIRDRTALTLVLGRSSTVTPLSCARSPQGDCCAEAATALDFLASPSHRDRKLCTGEIRIGEVRHFPART